MWEPLIQDWMYYELPNLGYSYSAHDRGGTPTYTPARFLAHVLTYQRLSPGLWPRCRGLFTSPFDGAGLVDREDEVTWPPEPAWFPGRPGLLICAWACFGQHDDEVEAEDLSGGKSWSSVGNQQPL
jgi:hypothetical protein